MKFHYLHDYSKEFGLDFLQKYEEDWGIWRIKTTDLKVRELQRLTLLKVIKAGNHRPCQREGFDNLSIQKASSILLHARTMTIKLP